MGLNTLRRVQLRGGSAYEATSVAGIASASFEMDFIQYEPAERIIFPHSQLTDFLPLENSVIITDPRRGVIWRVD